MCTVAFFKAMQQQTICEVANSMTCLWADNFCLQQWKNYYKKLSCRKETAQRFVSLNILLSHSRSLKVIQN